MRVVTVAASKGGTGKSTTAVHLAAAWAGAGRRVLVVDLDAQGTASAWVGVPPTAGLAGLFLRTTPGLASLTCTTRIPGLDVVPADPALVAVESLTAGQDFRELALADALAPLARRYDVAVLDTPPTLGVLTVAALVAATGVVVPVPGQALALPGLAGLDATVGRVAAQGHPRCRVVAVVLVRVSRTRLSADVAARVRAHYGPLVLDATVPESVKLAEAPSFALPVFDYAPESPGAVAYLAAARELWARWPS